MKLSNPPPETLRVTGAFGGGQEGGGSGGAEVVPTPGTTGAGTSKASDAARGAVTVELVTTLIGMATLVLGALCILLRRATNNGAGEDVMTCMTCFDRVFWSDSEDCDVLGRIRIRSDTRVCQRGKAARAFCGS